MSATPEQIPDTGRPAKENRLPPVRRRRLAVVLSPSASAAICKQQHTFGKNQSAETKCGVTSFLTVGDHERRFSDVKVIHPGRKPAAMPAMTHLAVFSPFVPRARFDYLDIVAFVCLIIGLSGGVTRGIAKGLLTLLQWVGFVIAGAACNDFEAAV
jgi:hypothetical protein